MIYTFNFPTRVRFGAGVRHELAEAVASLGIKRPLLVTDVHVAKLPWLAGLAQACPNTAVFDGVVGNPVTSQVDAGVAAFKAHQADGIIAIGGGAPLDVAKAIALMAHHPGHLFDYEDDKATRPIDQPIPAIVALPTTAGTGSEVGRSAVVSDNETHAKKIIFDPQLLPRIVLADPELTLRLPPQVTAATGMDALTHLVEAYCAKGYHPMCDGIALEGIGLVAQGLRASVAFARRVVDGDEQLTAEEAAAHVEARGQMLLASLMGATAFQKGLGVTHSCAHALSTVCDTHHGLANGVMIETCLRFNAAAVPERLLAMARRVDPAANAPADFIEWVKALRDAIGIPGRLSDIGVPKDALPALVDVALADACHPLNPRPVGRADFVSLFTEAFE